MTLRDNIEAVLEGTPGSSAPEIARALGLRGPAVREALSSMYTHHEVERIRHPDGHTWLWKMRAATVYARVEEERSPLIVESERPAYNEEQRVANRVRRMLAAKRGTPEPMSGAPKR